MTEFYIIRHTQAVGNLYRMMQGQWNSDITELGSRQIRALGERFRDVKVDAVYSSDLYRARVTAAAVADAHDLPVNTTPLLREIDFGPWEGRFFGNLKREYPEEMELFVGTPAKWEIEGAETYAQVRKRAFAFLSETLEKHSGESIVFVSHGVTVRCLLSAIMNIDVNDTETLPICKNTGVSHFFYENGQFTADYVNDSSHLGVGETPWHKLNDLRHESFDPNSDPDYYSACYRDAWFAAHGSLEGYNPAPYLRSAREHYAFDKNSVMRIFDGDEPVGLIDLDTERSAHIGCGWISLLYLIPEYRYQGYGIQLLGRAIAHYSALGRKTLRLHVAEDNKAAQAFYSRWGFVLLSKDGRLLLMEKKLGSLKNE